FTYYPAPQSFLAAQQSSEIYRFQQLDAAFYGSDYKGASGIFLKPAEVTSLFRKIREGNIIPPEVLDIVFRPYDDLQPVWLRDGIPDHDVNPRLVRMNGGGCSTLQKGGFRYG